MASKTVHAAATRGQSRKPKAFAGRRRGFALTAKGVVVVDAFARNLALDKKQLAETAGLPVEAIYKAARAKAPKTQSRLREMIEILTRVEDWAGGMPQALVWYRSEPIPGFGGQTPEALVKDGRAGALRDYLDHLATGGFA